MTTKKDNNRIAWVDWAKMLGIFIVVYAHIPNAAGSSVIFLFHMPFFLILSGYLYKERPFLEELRRTATQLLLPYVLYCFVLLILPPPIQGNRLYISILDVFLGNLEQLPSAFRPMWFVVSLALMRVLSSFFVTKKFAIAIASLCLVIILREFGFIGYDKDYFQLNTTLLCYHFFVVGYWLKQHPNLGIIKKVSKMGAILISSLTILFMLGLGYFNVYYGGVTGRGSVNLFRCTTGCSTLLFLLSSYAISLNLINVFQLCCTKTNAFVTVISSGTLLILCLHQYIIDLVMRHVDSSNVLVPVVMALVIVGLSYLAINISQRYCPILIGKKQRMR